MPGSDGWKRYPAVLIASDQEATANASASLAARRLRHQHRRCGGAPAFEVAMGLDSIAQRVAVVDLDLDLAALHHVEQVIGARQHREGSGLGL